MTIVMKYSFVNWFPNHSQKNRVSTDYQSVFGETKVTFVIFVRFNAYYICLILPL